MRIPRFGAIILALGFASAGVPGLRAQTETGAVTGAVVDARTGLGLSDASVFLSADNPATLVTRGRGVTWQEGLVRATDGAGRYRFDRVPWGRYRLRVRRLGYRPAEIAVNLRRTEAFTVSVGLEVLPIRLEAEEVVAPAQPFHPAGAPASERDARLVARSVRNERYLTTDAQVVTRSDVIEAVTLGEPDLFRALQRLPGVTTRDDFTAELWTRGAPWSQTRVSYDGLPLFNPVHASGLFTAVNPDAVGAVYFLPGVRPASVGEGTAGVLDLRSRSADGDGWGGSAELSAVSARGTVHRSFAGRGSIAASLRRSYADLFMEAVAGLTGDSTMRVPYAFTDGALQFAVPVGAATIEGSGLTATDNLRGDVRSLIRDSRGSWGNQVGRLTVLSPIGRAMSRTTVGASRFRGSLDLLGFGNILGDVVPVHRRMRNTIDWTRVESSVERDAGAGRVAGGVQYTVIRQDYDGPQPRPYPGVNSFDTLLIAASREAMTVWGETRVAVGPTLAMDLGLRLEVGDSARFAPSVHLAPRFAARWTMGDGAATVSAGWGRSFQFIQAIAPAGPSIGPDLHLTDVWLLAHDQTPALRSDIYTLGIEGWLGTAWTGAVNLYHRRTVGAATPDPTPGIFTGFRPTFVTGRDRASGIELSARKLVGRWTGSASYTIGISRIEAEGRTYPSPADRPGVLDVTALARLSSRVRVGGALTAARGAPYTRFIIQTLPCDSLAGPCPPAAGALTIEAPQTERTPSYVTLDILGEWTKRFATWELQTFVQLRNALNRRNRVTYVGSVGGCETPPPGGVVADRAAGICDLFDRGVPLLPLAGLRVAF